MNKINLVSFIVFSLAFSACYQKGSSNTSRPMPSSTSSASTPVAEKSAAPPSNQPQTAEIGGDELSRAKKAVESKPDDAEANFKLAKIYSDRKDYQAALPYFEKASKIKFTSVEYLMALGDNYRQLKKCDYAVVPYGKVMGFDDKNTGAYYGMGLCYIELKNRIAAGQQVRNLEKLDKNLAKKLEDQIPK